MIADRGRTAAVARDAARIDSRPTGAYQRSRGTSPRRIAKAAAKGNEIRTGAP